MKKLLLTLIAGASCLCLNAFRTDTVTLAGQGLIPVDMKVTTVVPTLGQRPDTGWNTLYLLHGHGGDHASWTTLTDPDLGQYADEYGLVIVMPSGMNSWYWDAPANDKMKMETFFTDVLVPWVDANLGTDPRAGHRAITGLSMGGHGSLWLGLRHPDIWRSCGSMSGGVDIRPFKKRWNMHEGLGDPDQYPQNWEEYTVINMVPALEPGQNNIIFDCGSEDFFAQVNENLHRALLDKKIPHNYTSRPGVHSHKYWRESLPEHLRFFQGKFSD